MSMEFSVPHWVLVLIEINKAGFTSQRQRDTAQFNAEAIQFWPTSANRTIICAGAGSFEVGKAMKALGG